MRVVLPGLLMVLSAQFLSACSNSQMYNSMQGAREQECQKMIDVAQRSECLSNAHKSYDRYEQQRNESRNSN